MKCQRCTEGMIAVGDAVQFCMCPTGRATKAHVKELRDDLRAEIAGDRPWRDANGEPMPRPQTAGDPAKILEQMGRFLPDEEDLCRQSK
jgi:hypothetical protein